MVEPSAGSSMAETRKSIPAEVSTPETTMQKHYDEFVTLHKEVVHIYGFQQQCIKIVQTPKDIHVVIAHVQE